MARSGKPLGPGEINDILLERLSDDEAGSDLSDAPPIIDPDDECGSELFGDDTDDDPDYVPEQTEAVEDSSGSDGEHQRPDQNLQPSTSSNRVADRCIVGRRNKTMIKKILFHSNGV